MTELPPISVPSPAVAPMPLVLTPAPILAPARVPPALTPAVTPSPMPRDPAPLPGVPPPGKPPPGPDAPPPLLPADGPLPPLPFPPPDGPSPPRPPPMPAPDAPEPPLTLLPEPTPRALYCSISCVSIRDDSFRQSDRSFRLNPAQRSSAIADVGAVLQTASKMQPARGPVILACMVRSPCNPPGSITLRSAERFQRLTYRAYSLFAANTKNLPVLRVCSLSAADGPIPLLLPLAVPKIRVGCYECAD